MSNSLPEQSEIVRSLTSNRDEALARYFSQVRERLARIVGFRLDYRLRGRISESDVIQDTYVRASQRIDSFLKQPNLPFFVWLRLEANQRLQEIHRHFFNAEKRDIRRELHLGTAGANQTSVALAAHLVAQMTSASQLVTRAEQIHALEQSLNEMNPLDREVIALRHFEELSNVETAQVLNIDPAAASKRYIRALQRLRQIMNQLAEGHNTGS
jgi:RNA polymerase sigma-70 factor (ECF subfamily)